MKINISRLGRRLFGASALAFLGAVLIPALSGYVSAAQLTTRSIQMSTSTPSATGQSYLVTFTTSTTTVKNIAIDFCSTSPIMADTCTAPTGFSAASATFTNVSGLATGWTVSGTTTANHFVISSATANSTTAVSFTMGAVTNPSTTGSFYARIYTYVAQTNDWVSATSVGTVLDNGGIALSTAALITITAKVQETMTFCVSAAALQPTNLTCGSATTPNLTIGHGTNPTIDATAVDTANAYMQLSTNATSGATVRMKASNSCANGGLSNSGGTTCNIPGNGSSAAAITAGTAAFGLFVAASANNATGSGTVTPATNYAGGGHTTIASDLWYGMNGTNVTSTYGDTIATSSAPSSLTNNQLVFAATAALTTQAGIYTTNESLIATGVF